MSNDREKIFSAIRAALDPLPKRTAMPDWQRELVVCRPSGDFGSLKEQLADKLSFASSRYCESIEQVTDILDAEKSTFGYCDPELAPIFEKITGITFDTVYDESKVNDYSFGITKASAAIAESGTIMLKDVDTSSRMGALTPWIHIAVLNETDIVATIPDAIERFGDDPSIVFATGPSKTADVEGILIEGVHGPGIQIALVLPD
jgi:L-lactate dehydrogenase complex protein LldG